MMGVTRIRSIIPHYIKALKIQFASCCVTRSP